MIKFAQFTDIICAYEKIKVAKTAGLDFWEGVILVLFILKDLLIVGCILAIIVWYLKEKKIDA